jgi:hypothetical protein
MTDLSQLPLKHRNGHDIEDWALLNFLTKHKDSIRSVLDVGAHFSHNHYARQVREIIQGPYHAIDILDDPITAGIVDKYYASNFLETALPRFSCVFSISAIEHTGISSYKADLPDLERGYMMVALCERSERLVFLTFPFGLYEHVPDQYDNIDDDELEAWEWIATDFGFKELQQNFYFNEFPQGGKPWKELSRDECAKIPRDPKIDQQTVAVCAWIKQ